MILFRFRQAMRSSFLRVEAEAGQVHFGSLFARLAFSVAESSPCSAGETCDSRCQCSIPSRRYSGPTDSVFLRSATRPEQHSSRGGPFFSVDTPWPIRNRNLPIESPPHVEVEAGERSEERRVGKECRS